MQPDSSTITPTPATRRHEPSTTAEPPAKPPCPQLPPIPVSNGVAVLYGYEVSARVERGHLALTDGIMDERREGRLNRATSGLRHLVILGHTGYVTLEALKWLRDLGVQVSVIDADGRVVLTTAPLGSDNARLRRAQVLAGLHSDSSTSAGQGLSIARDLIRTKLKGQASVAASLSVPETAERIAALAEGLGGAQSYTELRQLEGQAAGLYWQAWQTLPLRYARRDQKRVPAHWKTFGPRSSPIANGPRSAATPGNALLNYLYAVLETETRIALLTVGLDPGLGFLHTDQNSRDSLALDVMEAVRPEVDAWLLRLLRERTFARNDFFERHDGVCRVTAGLARELCATAPGWRRAVGPVAERIAQRLVETHGLNRRLPTPLSEANRSAGRDGVKSKEGPPENTKRPSIEGSSPSAERPDLAGQWKACKECGAHYEGGGLYCSEDCRRAYRTAELTPALAKAGPARLAELRANGQDPAHGGEAAKRRGASQAERARQRAAWEAEHGNGVEERKRFEKEIQPRLAEMPVRTIQKAIGCSLRYASLIRRGLYTPHPMHYAALNKLIESQPSQV